MPKSQLLAFLLIATLAACSSPQAAPSTQSGATTEQGHLTKIKMGMGQGLLSDAGVYIGIEQGYFREQGLELDIRRFGSGADQVALLSSGELDMQLGGISLPLYQAIERGGGMKVVADKGSTPGPEWDYIALAVRTDLIESGRVSRLEDLRGLTVTASGIGNSTEVGLKAGLARAGIRLDEETYIALTYGELAGAFSSYSIDAAMTGEPFVSQLENQGLAVRFMGNSELQGRGQQLGAVTYSRQFAVNTDLARRWMIAYVKGLRDYNDAFGPMQKNRGQIIDMLIKHTSVKERGLYEQMRPAGLHPDGRLDLDYIRFEMNNYGVADRLQLSQVVDASFLDYALAQLGPYMR